MSAAPSISRRAALAALLGATLGVACKPSDAPAEPVWGKEPCAHCRMLVSDKRYAAQALDEAGERRFFDDIGCMVLWTEAHPRSAHTWVKDATSGVWRDAATARYAPGARTPMDFGFEARSDGASSFDAVRVAVLQKKRESR